MCTWSVYVSFFPSSFRASFLSYLVWVGGFTIGATSFNSVLVSSLFTATRRRTPLTSDICNCSAHSSIVAAMTDIVKEGEREREREGGK